MAEAFAAFSVAANVVTFVEFGTKIFSAGYRLHKSARGDLDGNEADGNITADLSKVIDDLERSITFSSTHRQLTSNEQGLLELAKQCKTAAAKLLVALGTLKFQGKHGKWNTIRAALKAVWKETEIEEMQMSIDRFRQQLIVRILASLRDQIDGLKSTQASVSECVERIDDKMQGVGEEFLGLIQEAARTWKADIIHAIHQDKANAEERGLMKGATQQPEREVYLQTLLLRRLHFDDMEDRHNRISKAHETTFQWLYQDREEGIPPWSSFTKWLTSDSNLYWITGKAGSGKSTLMKYIYSNQRTFDGLEEWCGGKALHTAAFFFWNSGSEMQMSQLGLLRSIFHQILKNCPGLIPIVLPARWESSVLFGDDPQPWTLAELRNGFKLLAADNLDDKRICLFIDGLDEFDGDPMNLISLLKDIDSSPNIKICVSSRPWVEFEDAFRDRSSLRVQDLTYRDIQAYVSSHFLAHSGFAELERQEPEYASQLIEEITQKASGVFLWVNLVVHSLLAGFGNADRVLDLKRRLDFLPPDLENLYQKMLKSLDPFYLEHASQLFQLVRSSTSPPTILCLSFADEDEEYLFKSKVQPLTREQRLLRADLMKRRLNSRCKGLLEVAPGPSPVKSLATSLNAMSMLSETPDRRAIKEPEITLADHTVQYLHRTVKDYLESPKVWEMLLDSCHTQFDPQLALLRSSVLQLKILHPRSLDHEVFWSAVSLCISYASFLEEHRPSGELVTILDELDASATQLASQPGLDGMNFTRYYKRAEPPIYAENNREILRTTVNIKSTGSDTSKEGQLDISLHPGLVGNIWQPHWTCTLLEWTDINGFSFLSLAVKLNLRFYVNAKLTKGCLMAQGFGLRPALLDAVVHCPEADIVFPFQSFPNLDTINLLFEKGADPNWSYCGTTVWKFILKDGFYHDSKFHIEYRRSEKPELTTWLPTICAFLQHGADPAAIDSRLFGQIKGASKRGDHMEIAIRVLEFLQKPPRRTWPWR